MARRHSPSPSSRFRRRVTPEEEIRAVETRSLPAADLPAAAVRAQVLASQQAFAATVGGSVACICGSSIAERNSDESHVLRSGPQPRSLQCCALSPCGHYLAVGESGSGKTPQILVFDRTRSSLPTSIRGHHRGIRLLGWSPRSDFLVSIGDAETEQTEHQMILWSWPHGERLASALCAHGVMDISFSSEENIFAVISATTAKRWSIAESVDSSTAKRSKTQAQLIGQPVPINLLGISRSTDRQCGRRSLEDGLVSVAWGEDSTLFVLARRGRLTSLVRNEPEFSIDLNQRSCTMTWSPCLCQCSSQQGFIACGLTGGTVQVVDAGSLSHVATLSNGARGGSADAVGVSASLCGEYLWVLYADRSLARWRQLHEGPDCTFAAPVPFLSDMVAVPDACNPRVVTCTDRGLQLWTSAHDGLKMESRTEPGTSRSGELMSLASSSWAVACGHRGGEMHLHAIPSLNALEPMPVKHAGDVLALCFREAPQSRGNSLLLASASKDRSAMVFRIDVVRRSNSGGVVATRTTMLLTLPNHTCAVHNISLMGKPGASDGVITVCASDKVLMFRELELSKSRASVKRSHKHPGQNARWIDLCEHATRPVLFAACADRRLLELDSCGRCQKAIRIGGPDMELAAPLRLSSSGKYLALGVCSIGSNFAVEPGVLLVDATAGFAPLARFKGHAELASGFAFLSDEQILGCWADGAMLIWDALEQQALSSLDRHRNDASDRERIALSPLGTQQSVCTPNRGRELHSSKCDSAPPATRYPEGLLERLMASSPKPPKWAKSNMSLCEEGEATSFSIDVGLSQPAPLGRWARDSQVGAQVRSASDLLAISMDLSPRGITRPASGAVLQAPHRETGGSATARSASEGRAPTCPHPNFSDPKPTSSSKLGWEKRVLQPLPPKPRFPAGLRAPAILQQQPGGALAMSSASEGCGQSQCRQDIHDFGIGTSMMPIVQEETANLQPLPPKPRFPPPEFDEEPQKPASQMSCVQGKHVAAIVEELRTREADEVLIAVAKSLLAAKEVNAENVSPVLASNTPEMAPNLGCSVEAVAHLRAEVERLGERALNVLEREPMGSEVGALLRRVECSLRAGRPATGAG